MAASQSWINLIGFDEGGWGGSLLAGTIVTIELAFVSVIVGLALGIMLSLCKLSPWRALRWLAELFTILIRGIPEFLVLLIVFFLFSRMLEVALASIGFTNVKIPAFAAASAGLSIIFGTYASEVFRGAYIAVHSGQIEAAKALGMTSGTIFFRIRLPQIWRFAIPGLGNLWMVLLKDTSLAAVIAVDDVLRVAKVASESTQQPLTFYLLAGAIYLLLTGVSDAARFWLEKKSRKGYV